MQESENIEYTLPDKPNSRLQNRSAAEMAGGKYRLTPQGRLHL